MISFVLYSKISVFGHRDERPLLHGIDWICTAGGFLCTNHRNMHANKAWISEHDMGDLR